jgi:HD-GYP domain-containing protein (c-di-GMP phosphodiesterase class II)
MDGKGYPKGLTRDQMSVQARAMGIADVFEALTARDRPYKKGKTLTEALKILGFMCKDNHIDADLFKIFIDKKLYQIYADVYMNPGQIDKVVHSDIPGYQEGK